MLHTGTAVYIRTLNIDRDGEKYGTFYPLRTGANLRRTAERSGKRMLMTLVVGNRSAVSPPFVHDGMSRVDIHGAFGVIGLHTSGHSWPRVLALVPAPAEPQSASSHTVNSTSKGSAFPIRNAATKAPSDRRTINKSGSHST